ELRLGHAERKNASSPHEEHATEPRHDAPADRAIADKPEGNHEDEADPHVHGDQPCRVPHPDQHSKQELRDSGDPYECGCAHALPPSVDRANSRRTVPSSYSTLTPYRFASATSRAALSRSPRTSHARLRPWESSPR